MAPFEGWANTPSMAKLGAAAVAELLGSLFFVFIGVGSVAVTMRFNPAMDLSRLLVIAFAHGIGLSVAVGGTAAISGGHINPAVTLGLLSVGITDLLSAFVYIIAQLVGGTIGAAFAVAITPDVTHSLLGHGLAKGVTVGQGVFAELLLTALLLFAVFSSAVDPSGPAQLAPLLIGLAVLVDHLVGVPITGASMNPMRSFSASVVSGNWANQWVYWVGPILGALLMSLAYTFAFLLPRASDRLPSEDTGYGSKA